MFAPLLMPLFVMMLAAVFGCATQHRSQTLCKEEPNGVEDCSQVVPGAIPPVHATDLGPGQAPGMGLTKPN